MTVFRVALSFLQHLILLRGHAHCLGEEAGIIVGVIEAELEGDLVDFHIGLIQQEAGVLDLQEIEIGQRAVTGLALEDEGEMGERVADGGCDFSECKPLLDSFLHKVDGDFLIVSPLI